MEKHESPNMIPVQPVLTKRRPLTTSVLIVALVVAIGVRFGPATGTWFPLGSRTGTESPETYSTFSWDRIDPKPYLDYTNCFDGFQCARLELPMDWWNGTTNASISLAVARKPAKVPVTDPSYGGAILLNPGGPGGSGISLLISVGEDIQKIVAGKKNFDLISFDPRGVGESLPAVQCTQDLRAAQSWQVRVMEEGVFEASDAALGRLWSMAIAHSKSCSLPLEDGEADIRKYVTTASVARDMLEIVEAHGQWREKEAEKELSAAAGCGRHSRSALQVPQTVAYKPTEEKIQYWGFSYGTYLGNTFAAMFPDRVHRLIVDGVVDAYNYKKTLWSDNLFDTEKDMNAFYYHCARAGYPACALANKEGETTAEGVSQRVAKITNSLLHNPLPVIGPNPEVVTYSDVKNLIFAGLYSPVASFPFVANLLAGVEEGNGTAFAELLKPYHSFSCPGEPGSGYSIIPLRNVTKGVPGMSYDATTAIACSDGDDQSHLNKTAFAQYARELARVSPSIGSMWSTVRLQCIHYSIRAHHRFAGPWEARTSHPLLLIGNTMDPVTPVRNAHKMARGFPGAVALTQDSAGHCSLSAHSSCTLGYIRRYFETGKLPPEGEVCRAEEMPFGPGPGGVEVLSTAMREERRRQARFSAALQAAGGAYAGTGLRASFLERVFEE